MKTRAIFIAICIIIISATLGFFSGWILLLPSLIGFSILTRFERDDVAKYIAFLSLKPASSIFVFFLADKLNISSYYSLEIFLAVSWFVPELIMTLFIVYSFRYLFSSEKIVWLFLIGDIIRWLSLSIEGLLHHPFPEYPAVPNDIPLFLIVLYPSLYAIGGLIAVILRINRQKTGSQK